MTIKSENSSVNILVRIILLSGANIALMAGSSLSPGMPAMMAEFQNVPGVEFWISMIITLPALFVVLGGPVIGYFTDRFGRKPVLVMSLLLGGLGGSAAVFLNSIGAILITRALVGLSIAGTTTATNSLIADYFEGQQRAKFMGAHSAFTGLAGVVILSVGGILADLNWRYSFLAYLPLLILFPLATAIIFEPEKRVKSERSILEAKLKISPAQIYIYAAVLLSQFTFVTIPVFIAYYLTSLLGVGALEVGLIGAASGLFSFFGGLLYERIGRRMPFREVAVYGSLLFGGGYLALGLATSWSLVIVGELVLGFCMGLSASNLATWLAHDVDEEVRGRANGIFVTMMFLGQFLTSFFFTTIANRAGLNAVYLVSAGIIVLTGLGAFLLKRQPLTQA